MRLTLLLALLGCALHAQADWQTRSWSRWQIEERGAHALFGIERIELERLGLPADPAWLVQELRATITLDDGDHACALAEAEPVGADAALLQVRLRFSCALVLVAPRVRIRLLLDDATSPMHYAAFTGAGDWQIDALFTRAADAQVLATAAPVARGTGGVLFDYFALGFEHILSGADHVAFLVCMLLVSSRLGHRLWMITGFTLGHSLTLSLATLGLLSAQSAGVEALIGFTVALLAAECWQRRCGRSLPAALLVAVLLGSAIARGFGVLPALPLQSLAALLALAPAYLLLVSRSTAPVRLHLGMTAVFGLVHGLGFAAVLQTVGVPDGRRGWALAGFNLGVEAGQLALLLLFAALLAGASRLAGNLRLHHGERALAGMLCALGVFWFVARSAALA